MLDGRRLIARFVRHDGQVVMRSALRGSICSARRNRLRASATRPAARCSSARLTSDSTLRGSSASATRSSAAAASGRFDCISATPRLLCALTYFGSSAIARWAVFVQKAEVIVHFRARVVLLEQHTIMRERAVEVARAVVVERQFEMVLRRRRGKRRNRRHRNRFWNSLRRRRAR